MQYFNYVKASIIQYTLWETHLIRLYLRLGDSALVKLVPDSEDAVTYKGPKNLRLFQVGTLK